MPLTGFENAGARLNEPGGNRRFGLGGGKRPLEYCRGPQKCPQCQPRETNEVRPRNHRFEPGLALVVLLRSRLIGVKQEVRVDEDHRWSEPSTCSMSCAMLSRQIPGFISPRSRAVTSKASQCVALRWLANPRRIVLFTISRKGRPARRDSALSLAAISSSRVSLVLMGLMLWYRHHDVNKAV